MAFILRLRSMARNLVRKDRVEHDLDDEIRGYLDMLTEEKIRRGLPRAEARREATIELGGVEQVKEQVREARLGSVLESVFFDFRSGVRSLAGSGGFAAIALLSLALGIGSAAAMFSVVDGALLRPLPYADSDRLLRITDFYPKGAVAEMQRSSRTMELAAFTTDSEFNLGGVGDTAHVSGSAVSPELFSLLGARARLGRVFGPGEDRPSAGRAVLLSDGLWRRAFQADPGILGRSITVDGEERNVVGIMPPEFAFPSPAAQLWVPVTLDPANWVDAWGAGFVPLIGKLRPGATVVEAREELRRLIARIIPLFPYSMARNWNADADVIPFRQAIIGDIRGELAALTAAVAIVLMIACINLASLLLSRTATRRKELAVRVALGASSSRVTRQLVTESLVLAAGGGGLGIALAFGVLAALQAVLPADAVRVIASGIDWRAVIFAMGAAAATGSACGMICGLGLSKLDLVEATSAGGPRVTGTRDERLRRGLIAGEVALTVMLVISAGLLIKSLWQMTQVNPGFRAEHVLTVRVYRDQASCNERSPCVAFYEALLRRTRAISGVSDAAAVNALPFSREAPALPVEVEGHPLDPEKQVAPLIWAGAATPEYFRIMRIPILAGRPFRPADDQDAAGVVVVSEAMAQRFWPGQDPIGKHLRPVWDERWRAVVAVVGDVRGSDLAGDSGEARGGAFYMPYAQSVGMNRRVPAAMILVVRTTADPSEVMSRIRAAVRESDPAAPAGPALTMEAVVSASTSQPRSMMWLFVGFASSALALVAAGVYGLISYSVARRKHEIGIRLALGAARGRIYSLVLGQSMMCVLAGLAAGLPASLALARLMRPSLFQVTPTDPITYLAVALIVAAVAAAAAYVPSRRAVRQNPTEALRIK
jgi:predicted permease